MKDGWHVISGYDVYVNHDRVIRGVKNTLSDYLSAWPYRWSNKYKAWIEESGLTVAAFRSAVSRGTVKMF